ncbi:MAG UNVERIFIED_CONTAM: hypothetical protein LVR18_20105 [Planctomycetaceae bacterium]|jgi:hypothetical protein
MEKLREVIYTPEGAGNYAEPALFDSRSFGCGKNSDFDRWHTTLLPRSTAAFSSGGFVCWAAGDHSVG